MARADLRARRALGMNCFSTPFDATAVDFLEELDVPAYKIASFENTDLPLIRRVAATGKPMIISTGMASVAEIDEAVRRRARGGLPGLVLLKCTSTYPATPENTQHPAPSRTCARLFGCEVGLSDHTMGIGVAVAAVALGAIGHREALHARAAPTAASTALSRWSRRKWPHSWSRPSARGKDSAPSPTAQQRPRKITAISPIAAMSLKT